jgi:hypothetical protein
VSPTSPPTPRKRLRDPRASPRRVTDETPCATGISSAAMEETPGAKAITSRVTDETPRAAGISSAATDEAPSATAVSSQASQVRARLRMPSSKPVSALPEVWYGCAADPGPALPSSRSKIDAMRVLPPPTLASAARRRRTQETWQASMTVTYSRRMRRQHGHPQAERGFSNGPRGARIAVSASTRRGRCVGNGGRRASHTSSTGPNTE